MCLDGDRIVAVVSRRHRQLGGVSVRRALTAQRNCIAAGWAHEKMRGMSGPPRFIEVKVRPGARESALRQDASGAWLAQLRSPPTEGKANAELIALVARHFGCRKSAVSIKRGATGRRKLIEIESP
jgi:uncharacterized protein